MKAPENTKTAVIINAVIFLEADIEDIASPEDYNEIFCEAFGLEDTPFVVDYRVDCDVVEAENDDDFAFPDRRVNDLQYYGAKVLVMAVTVLMLLFVLFGWQG